MGNLFLILIFFFLGYLLGMFSNSKMVWLTALISGLMGFLFLDFASSIWSKLYFTDYLENLTGGFIVFVSVLAGGKMGVDLRGSKKK